MPSSPTDAVSDPMTRQPAAITSRIDEERTELIGEIDVARRHWGQDAPGAARPAELAGTPGGPAQPRNRDRTRARPRQVAAAKGLCLFECANSLLLQATRQLRVTA